MINKPFVTIALGASAASHYASQRYNIVVVDVLRATSTIIVALAQGAKEIIPSADIEETKSYKKIYNALTIGERQGKQLPGFDFTNSPFDLSTENLERRIVAITSTAGTPLIVNSLGAPKILIGSTLNAYAVAKAMQRLGGKWAVIGAGPSLKFLEDKVGCAIIAQHFIQLTKAETSVDSQKIIDQFSHNEKKHIINSSSTPQLVKLGRKCDVDFVIEASNKYNIVPIVQEKEDKNGKRLSITQK